jgi:hypothetical protein
VDQVNGHNFERKPHKVFSIHPVVLKKKMFFKDLNFQPIKSRSVHLGHARSLDTILEEVHPSSITCKRFLRRRSKCK